MRQLATINYGATDTKL